MLRSRRRGARPAVGGRCSPAGLTARGRCARARPAGPRACQLSWSLSVLPALNFADLEAAIWMVSPVLGLRPARALRAETANVPKPEMFTLSPLRSGDDIVEHHVDGPLGLPFG